jgi:hypothetical protein
MSWGWWECSTLGRNESAYNIFVGKPEDKRQLGRPMHIWVDKTRMDISGTG